MRCLFIILLILNFQQIQSKFLIDEIDKIDLQGKSFFTESDEYFYSVIPDEFNRSIRIDRIQLGDSNITETKLIENSSLISIDKEHQSPYLLVLNDDKLNILEPFSEKNIKLDLSLTPSTNNKFHYFNDLSVLFYNNTLYKINSKDSLLTVKNNILDATKFDNVLWFVESSQNNLILYKGSENSKLRFDFSEDVELLAGKTHLAFINKFSESNFISFVSPDMLVSKSGWYDNLNSKIEFKNSFIIPTKSDLIEIGSNLSENVLLGKNNIDHFDIDSTKLVVISDQDLIIKAKDITNLEIELKDITDLKLLDDRIYLLSDQHLSILKIRGDDLWLLKYIFLENWIYFLLLLLIISILILIRKIRTKNVMLKNVFDLASTGIIIHLDSNGNILNMNKQGKGLLNLPESVPMGRFFQYYFTEKGFAELVDLIDKSLKFKEEFSQKISLTINKNIYEFLCSTSIIKHLTGSYKGIIINAVDITEQLERKRLANWAQLAHDMQTNLSIIKLNSEQINTEDNYENEKRIKKIKHQTGILINRVRDIITVGRSTRIDKSDHYTQELFSELISEFELEERGIKLNTEIDNFIVKCDKGKIQRALRNALENSIKALPKENGAISLSAKRDNRFSYLSVGDNGRGMDKTTRENMLNPYFTKGNKGGTGIGTMIMQNAIEQHGGEIIINSEPNFGTEIVFKIPNFSR